MNIALLMIEKGALDWNCGLRSACDGPGEARAQLADFAPFTTDELANLRKRREVSQLRAGLARPSDNNKIELVQLMIRNGANKCTRCKKTIEEHLTNI